MMDNERSKDASHTRHRRPSRDPSLILAVSRVRAVIDGQVSHSKNHASVRIKFHFLRRGVVYDGGRCFPASDGHCSIVRTILTLVSANYKSTDSMSIKIDDIEQ